MNIIKEKLKSIKVIIKKDVILHLRRDEESKDGADIDTEKNENINNKNYLF